MILQDNGKNSIARGKRITKSQKNYKKTFWNSADSTAKALYYVTCNPDFLLVQQTDKCIIICRLENDYI